MAMLVTHISAVAGACTWMLLERINHGKASALGAVTGMVAGLGTITPASGFVGPGGGLIIGLSAGFVCYYATGYIKRTLKIDDSLDVFPVHGVGGILVRCSPVCSQATLWASLAAKRHCHRRSGVLLAIGILASIALHRGRHFCNLKGDRRLGRQSNDEEDEMQGLFGFSR